ncbi:Sec-independent protein translocase protein TatB [Rhizobium sp. G187]|uniref:Sec-independent protein translocase protein TatB n=1 Tax=Rhizobium sp. G187 TaxID=3451352 RepID=UPI003EE6D401
MLDIGWTELLVIAVILIVVVGPKDLPPMIRAFGKMTKRLRQTAGEFRSQFDEALREAELDDLKKSVDDIRSLNPANSIRETFNPLRQMGQDIKSDLERQTRYEPKTSAPSGTPITAGEGHLDGASVQNSILPELPVGLGEPPAELRPTASVPTPAAATTVPTAAVAAASPASSAPSSVAPAVAKKVAVKKPAVAKAKPNLPVAEAEAAPKKTRKAASSAAPAETKSVAKPAAKPRKTKSEDRA